MVDRIIDYTLKTVFSVPSFIAHAMFFVAQLVFHINQNLVTNLISWEAIFLAVMIGIQQLRHHDVIKETIKHVDNISEDSNNEGGA